MENKRMNLLGNRNNVVRVTNSMGDATSRVAAMIGSRNGAVKPIEKRSGCSVCGKGHK